MSFAPLTGHLIRYFANIRIRIISAFFHIKKILCRTSDKALPYNPNSKNSEVTGYFEEVFFPKTATKTRQFVYDDFHL